MFESFDHFEIDEIEVFLDITPSNFNNANVSRGLSGVLGQQPLLMGLVRKHPVRRQCSYQPFFSRDPF